MTTMYDLEQKRRFILGVAEVFKGSGLRFNENEGLSREVQQIIEHGMENLVPFSELQDRIVAHMQQQNALEKIPSRVFDEIEQGFAEARPGREFTNEYRAEIERFYDLGLTQSSMLPQLIAVDERKEANEIMLAKKQAAVFAPRATQREVSVDMDLDQEFELETERGDRGR
jgi:hypothetical protein